MNVQAKKMNAGTAIASFSLDLEIVAMQKNFAVNAIYDSAKEQLLFGFICKKKDSFQRIVTEGRKAGWWKYGIRNME